MNIQYAAENHFNTRIKIIGVGGSGGNAINAMINKEIEGVEYIVANKYGTVYYVLIIIWRG